MIGSERRALARVAWRDIARHKGRSLLVALLVLLPVAAMVGGIAVFRTTQPTPEVGDTARMGRADLIAHAESRADFEALLPPGSVVEPVTQIEARLELPGARPSVSMFAADLDGLAHGMFALVDGRLPRADGEAAISAPVAKLAGVGIGDGLALVGRTPVQVVGLVENPQSLSQRVIVVDPGAASGEDSNPVWLISLPPGTDIEALLAQTFDPASGEQQVLVHSRRSSQIAAYGDSLDGTILVLGALALVEAALIASAAFAVSIRRRQRDLGLLAAAGASPGQLAGTVVAEAAILGAVACFGGVVVGFAAALGVSPWLDELTQRRNPPIVIDLAGIVVPVAIGFAAALVAAVVPARTVARVPVLLALSGRRPPQAPARRVLRGGLAMVGLAAAMTLIGGTMRYRGDDTFAVALLIGGAVLGTLGFGACAPWLLERLEGFAARLPIAGRIGFRDTARARSRSSPIVTAALSSCAALIAIGAWTASRDGEHARNFVPALYPEQVVIAGTGAMSAGEELEGQNGIVAGAPLVNLVPEDPEAAITYQLPDARDADGKPINLAEDCVGCAPGFVVPYEIAAPMVATPELLRIAHAESAAEDLAAGRAVVLTTKPMTASFMEIRVYGPQSDPETTTPDRILRLPVRLLLVQIPGGILPEAFLPEPAIRELGLLPTTQNYRFGEISYVVQFDHAVGEADLDRVRQVAARYPETMADAAGVAERPGQGFRLLLIGLVILFALSVTGVAIALGEAESRPEQRTLLAIGADPRLRRRIAASRAAVLALLAGILAVPAGLLPIWGIFVSRGSPLAVPTLEIAGVVLALPVLAVLSSLVLSRPIPDWGSFRSVRPGE